MRGDIRPPLRQRPIILRHMPHRPPAARPDTPLQLVIPWRGHRLCILSIIRLIMRMLIYRGTVVRLAALPRSFRRPLRIIRTVRPVKATRCRALISTTNSRPPSAGQHRRAPPTHRVYLVLYRPPPLSCLTDLRITHLPSAPPYLRCPTMTIRPKSIGEPELSIINIPLNLSHDIMTIM